MAGNSALMLIKKLFSKPESQNEVCFCLVFNIPPKYNSKHLRNYFHYLIEKDAFVCFHYRHRQQKFAIKNNTNGLSPAPVINDRCCVLIAIRKRWISVLIDIFSNKFWPSDVQGGNDFSYKCYIRPLSFENDLLQNLTSAKDSESILNKTEMLLDPRSKEFSKKFLRDFDDKPNEDIKKLKLSEMLTLLDFKTPNLMPNGNVGTSSGYFLEKIKSCQLLSRIITSLGLKFPPGRIKRQNSEVPYDYGDKNEHLISEIPTTDQQFEQLDDTIELVRTANGQIISDVYVENKKFMTEEQIAKFSSNNDDGDGDDLLLWKTQDQESEEFIFEVGVTWQYGRTDLVFYTDDQFAKLLDTSNNDFDAVTADNFNIEHNPEYSDEYMNDLHNICQRKHIHDQSMFINCDGIENCSEEKGKIKYKDKQNKLSKNTQTNVGFELISKYPFGAKILMKFGWKPGQGLGIKNNGIPEPLVVKFRAHYDKRGLGCLVENT